MVTSTYQKKILLILERDQTKLSKSLNSGLVLKEGRSIGCQRDDSRLPGGLDPGMSLKNVRSGGPGREMSSSSQDEGCTELHYLPSWCPLNSKSMWPGEEKKCFPLCMQGVQCVPNCPRAWRH